MDKQTLEYLEALFGAVNRILKTNIIGHENVREEKGGLYDAMQPYFRESKIMVDKCLEAEVYFKRRAENFHRPTMD